jgi:DNA repair protein RecN (Recombination protein N)
VRQEVATVLAIHSAYSHFSWFPIITIIGIPSEVITWVRQLQRKYNKCRRHRGALEKELRSQILPVSLNLDGDKDVELLGHWLEELDGFEARVSNFCQSLSSQSFDGESRLQRRIEDLEGLSWMDSDADGVVFSSSLYRELLQLLDYIKSLDARIEAAMQARDALVSMSAPDSARTALERTRQLLLDATAGDEDRGDSSGSNPITKSSEKAHQLLNHVEDVLMESARFFDDDSGLLSCLKAERSACSRSSNDVNGLIFEWNTLARKHGISSYVLPSCHNSLRQELDGNVEAKRLLPQAIADEKEALDELQKGTAVLSEAREKLTQRISKAVSERLPMLGMEHSNFEARLRPLEDPSYSGSTLGIEEVDFLLLHDNAKTRNSSEKVNGKSSTGGKVDLVASSGEKARILLAIECEVPGSVRALCGTSTDVFTNDNWNGPVAVIYDEIDAHVGGRASVAVGQMLSDQSQSCQVVAITHSPSVAAIADLHICIHKEPPGEDGSIIASATQVQGLSRRKELARMASGDMATEEAEVFAEALIRDVTKQLETRKLTVL